MSVDLGITLVSRDVLRIEADGRLVLLCGGTGVADGVLEGSDVAQEDVSQTSVELLVVHHAVGNIGRNSIIVLQEIDVAQGDDGLLVLLEGLLILLDEVLGRLRVVRCGLDSSGDGLQSFGIVDFLCRCRS